MSEANLLGAALRRMREARGLSLDALGKRSGKGFSYIGRVERGEVQSPGLLAMLKVCRALGVSVQDLLVEAGLEGAPVGYRPPERDETNQPATRGDMQNSTVVLRKELAALRREVNALAKRLDK